MSLPKVLQKIINNVGYGQALTGNDNDIVHKTGDEFINSVKTFKNKVIIRNNATKGTYPEETLYGGLALCDASTPEPIYGSGNTGRFGILETHVQPDGVVTFEIVAYKNALNAADKKAHIAACYDTEADIAFATAPSTSSLRNGENDILTRNWIPKDDRIVHTTGNETISGSKTFTNASIYATNSPAMGFKHNQLDGIVNPPDATKSWQISFSDKNDTLFGRLRYEFLTTGSRAAYLGVVNGSGVYSQIYVGYDQQGRAFAIAPSTDGSRATGQDIVTRDWLAIDSRLVHTTGSETINGAKEFTNDVWILNDKDPGITIKNTGYTRKSTPSANKGWGINLRDSNSQIQGYFRGGVSASKDSYIYIGTYSGVNDNDVSLMLHYEPSGDTYVAPSTNGTTYCGIANFRWKQVYAATSTIGTSDERLKSSISSVPDNVLDAWGEVDFLQFKFNDAVEKKGFSARLHSGLVAQRIDDIFKSHGIDISNYGLFCYDKWEAKEEIRDADDIVVQHPLEAGDCYSLRYEEALCMEAAYNRRRVSRLEEKIKLLEQKLNLAS